MVPDIAGMYVRFENHMVTLGEMQRAAETDRGRLQQDLAEALWKLGAAACAICEGRWWVGEQPCTCAGGRLAADGGWPAPVGRADEGGAR